jgi:hypothetical protein
MYYPPSAWAVSGDEFLPFTLLKRTGRQDFSVGDYKYFLGIDGKMMDA